MLNMHTLISRMLVILLLLCTGFAARKAKYLDEVSNQKLSRIIISVQQRHGSGLCHESGIDFVKAQAPARISMLWPMPVESSARPDKGCLFPIPGKPGKESGINGK